MWFKVVLAMTNRESDIIDLLTNFFFEQGSIGVEVDYAHGYLENHPNLFGEIAQEMPKERLLHDTEVIAYFDEIQDLDALSKGIKQLDMNIMFSLEQSEQKDENWQTNWMAHYKVQEVTRFITIVPAWIELKEAKTSEHRIILDPGIAFGTGSHPTTQLGIQALETVMRGGEIVLDVGTGSGVLAFVSKALGASEVYGFDLDPQAVESAKENLKLQNYTDHSVHFQVNDLLKGVETSADIIVANILPHILIHLLSDAYTLLRPKGTLILGGILEEKSLELEEILPRYQFKVRQKLILNGWVSLIVEKSEER